MSETPIETMLDNIHFEPCELPDSVEEGELYATHVGYLDIADCLLKCFVLNNGQRVIDADSMNELFGEELINSTP